MKNQIIVCPVLYKYEDKKSQKYGIRIINRKTNTQTVIDCKTLKSIHGMYSTISLECNEGNIIFNLKC